MARIENHCFAARSLGLSPAGAGGGGGCGGGPTYYLGIGK